MQLDLTVTEIAIAGAAGVVAIAYIGLVLLPAWTCYGRFWERAGASFLTLYILATLLGIGAAIGFAVVWTYDTYGS